jgi:hypothetical protein
VSATAGGRLRGKRVFVYWPAAQRGRCSYLSNHSANFTLAYDTPWGKSSSSMLVKTVLANWQITSQTLVSSGVPFTVTQDSDIGRHSSLPLKGREE